MNRFLIFHLILFLLGSSLIIHQFVSATAVVSTVVGFSRGCGFSGDGSKSTTTSDDASEPTLLSSPTSVRLDSLGNICFADKYNNAIRMLDVKSGIVSTIVREDNIVDFLFDEDDNIYFLYSSIGFLKFFDRRTKISTILAGNSVYTPRLSGKGTEISLGVAYHMTFDNRKNIYISSLSNSKIYYYNKESGNITTVVGVNEVIGRPRGLAVDVDDNLYFTDEKCVVRFLNKSTGVVSIIAGQETVCQPGQDGVKALKTRLYFPQGIFLDKERNIYITEAYSKIVRFINATTSIVSTLIGSEAKLESPSSTVADKQGRYYYVADTGNNLIKKFDSISKTTEIILGVPGFFGYSGDGKQVSVAMGNIATLNKVVSVAFDEEDNYYIADRGNAAIRFVNKTTNIIETIVGDKTNPQLSPIFMPSSVKIHGSMLYIAEYFTVKQFNLTSRQLSTVAGKGIANVQLSSPTGLCFDKDGNIYIGDASVIIYLNLASGTAVNYAGTSSSSDYGGDGGHRLSAKFNYISDLAFDSEGNMFVADSRNSLIRMINKTTNIVTTVVGVPTRYGFSFDNILANTSLLNYPTAISIDRYDNLYIADSSNLRIRKVNRRTGIITTIVGSVPAIYFNEGDGGPAELANIPSIVLAPIGVTLNKDELFFTQANSVRKVSGSICGESFLNGGEGVCSSQGECDPMTDTCSCFEGWGSWNCSERVICSGNGVLVNDSCICNGSYYGSNCQYYSCFNKLSNDTTVCNGKGKCISPDSCKCNNGYFGITCSQFTCFGIVKDSPTVCHGNGNCDDLDSCSCAQKYGNNDCTLTCFGNVYNSTNVCSGHGVCQSVDKCNCSVGYGGDNCELPICFSILSSNASVCSSHGVCTSPDRCECQSTHDGLKCEHEIPVCFGISYLNTTVCSGHGACDSANYCICQGGWTGDKCEMTTCYNISMNEPSVCSSHGACKSIDNCECDNGWYSSNCSLTRCFGIASNSSTVCSSHGYCTSPDTCFCIDKYLGSSCNSYMCSGIDSQNETVCSGKGKCLSPDTCRCDEYYSGSNCEKYCRNEIHCSSHGECLSDATCQCYSNSSMGYFTGSSCNVCEGNYLGNMCFTKINQNSLEFSPLGTELLFNMLSQKNTNPDCKELIHPSYIPLLGSQPICRWKNFEKGIFEIVLGAFSMVKIGNTIPINVNIYTNSVIGSYLNCTVHSPSQPLIPIGYISNTESIYGSCDGVVLDGSSSKSLDGTSLLYKWKMVEYPSLDSIVSAEQLEKSIVALPSSIPEGYYRFQLIVTSTLFGIESNPVNYNFTKRVTNIPHLGIDGPSLITIGYEQVPLYIKKYQYFDSECNNTSPTLMSNFKWTLLEGPSNIQYQQLSNGDLFISSFEEKSPQKYVFELSATFLQNELTKTVTISTVEEPFSIILYQSLLNSTHVILNFETEPILSFISNSEWIFTCVTSQNFVCENSILEKLNSSAKNHLFTGISLPYSSASKPSFQISLKIRDTIGSIKIDIPKPDEIVPVISLVSVSPQKQSYLSTDILSVQFMVSVDGNSDSIDNLITREWMLNGNLITSSNLVSDPSTSNFMALDLSLLESGTLNNLIFKVSSKTQSTSTYSLPFSIEKNPDPCSCTVTPTSGYALETIYSIVCLKCLIPGVTTISIGFVGSQNVETTLVQQSSQSTLNIQLPYISSTTLTLFAISEVISTKSKAKVYFTTTVLLPIAGTPVELKKKKASWDNTAKALSTGDPRKIVFSYSVSIFNLLLEKIQSTARFNKEIPNDCGIVENEWTDLIRIALNDSMNLFVEDYNARNQLESMTENLLSYQISTIYQLFNQPKYSSKELIENGLSLLQRVILDSVKSPNLQISPTVFKAIISTITKISNAATCYQYNNITPQLISLIENISTVKMRNQLTGSTLSIETDSASLISTRYYPFDLSNRKLYYGILPEEFMSYPNKATQFLPSGTNLRKPLQSKLWKIIKNKIETSQNSVTTNVGFSLSNNLISSEMKLSYSFLFNSSVVESRVDILENGRIKNNTVEMLCLSDNFSCVLGTISKLNFICNCGNDSNISLAQRVTTSYLDAPITPPSPSSRNQIDSNLGFLGFLALIPLILIIILIPVVAIIVRLKIKQPKTTNPQNPSDIPMQTL